MTETDGVSQEPNYNEVTYKSRMAIWFEKCDDTKKTIWPFQKVWERTYWLIGGAIAGAPPIQTTKRISDKAYVVRILTNNK